jgi:hypothetical protein
MGITDQILARCAEHPCANEQARILAPTPHIEANQADAQRCRSRSEHRTSAANKHQINNAAVLISQQEALARRAAGEAFGWYCTKLAREPLDYIEAPGWHTLTVS